MMKKMTREELSKLHNAKAKAEHLADEYRKRQIKEASRKYRRMCGLPVEEDEENGNDTETSDSAVVHGGGESTGR